MNIFELAICVVIILLALYMLNQLYIVIQAYRWKSQDKLIARALEKRDV